MVIQISKNLREASFIICKKQDKKPLTDFIGDDWNNKIITYAHANHKIEQGFNIGLVFGENDFIGIDCDRLELAQACEGLLPKTYTEQTCSGGYHYLYKIDKKFDNQKIEDDKNHYGEIRSLRQYVVIAPSKAINKQGILGDYSIVNDREIPYVTPEQIKEVISQFMKPKEKIEAEGNVVELMEKYNLHNTDKWLYDLVKNQIFIKEETGLNSIVFKNAGIILSREGIKEPDRRVIGKGICDWTENNTLPMLYGWIKKAENNQLAQVNEVEINKFIERNDYPLTKYENKPKEIIKESFKGLDIKTFGDIFKIKRDKSFIVDEVFYPKTICMIYSPPAMFKSLLAFSLGISIATGKEWLGFKTKKLPVLYCDNENNLNMIRERTEGFYNGSKMRRKKIPFYLLKGGLIIDAKKKVNIPFVESLEETIKKYKIKFLIFDTLHRFAYYDENKSDDINMLYSEVLNPIREKYGVTILFLHHSTKVDRSNKSTYRGSGDFLGMVDTAYSIFRSGKSNRFYISCEKSRSGEREKIMGEIIFGENSIKAVQIIEGEATDESINKVKQKELSDRILINMVIGKEYRHKEITEFLIAQEFNFGDIKASSIKQKINRALSYLEFKKDISKSPLTNKWYKEIK